MSQVSHYPPVTESLLETVVQRILSVGTPLKIILFGSQARSEAGPDSDLDLLIIEESDLPRYRRASRYLRVLTGLFPAKDVLVWTPDEVKVWENVPNTFIMTALSEGKTLYAR